MNTHKNHIQIKRFGNCEDCGAQNLINGYPPGEQIGIGTQGIAKLDNIGNLIWKRQLGSGDYDQAFSVAIDKAGNTFLVGYALGSFEGEAHHLGNFDAFITKIDSGGNLV